jgi:hypothetical protein|tara:strand:- start:1303 stop:1593 length:291 start_codon:yes stop_codon:yes gene_type:complete
MNKEIFNQLLNKKLLVYSLDKELNTLQKQVLTTYLGRWLLYKKNPTRYLFDFEQKGLVIYLSGLNTSEAKKALEKFLRVEEIEYKLIIEMGVEHVR